MEVVAPASLQTAVNVATPGETIALAGVFRENLKIGKAGVKLIPKDNAPAVIIGRLWITGADVTVRNLLLDGRNPANLPSPTIDGARGVFAHNEVTNANTAIAFNTTNYAGAQPDDVLIEHNWIHHVGSLPPANHDHGVYLAAGRRAVVRHNLIHDCADRGIQLYSYAQAHDALIEYNLVAYCGQGILVGGGEAGEPACRAMIHRNIVAFCQTVRGGFEEWWNGKPPGTGNRMSDNILWDPPDQRQDKLLGVTVTGMKVVDPLFTNASLRDFKLRAGSPAIGYGPASIQPTGPPPPREDTFTLAQVMQLERENIAYYRSKRNSWATVKASPGGRFYYEHGGK